MKEMSKFQLILMAVFGALVFFGVLIFSLGRFGNSGEQANVLVWGFIPQSQFSQIVSASGLDKNKLIQVQYVEKNPATFEQEFIEELASARGPDLFFLSHDLILRLKDKVFPIPFDSLSERDFKDVFIQGGEIYLAPSGSLGVPLVIDPMVMYWNRTIFSNAGLSVPPKHWSEFYDLASKLTFKDAALNVTQSAVALGEYNNINHAMDIISVLIMQAGGSPVVVQSNGPVISTLASKFGAPVPPGVSALNFFTEFSNPLKPFYSWNRSLQTSKDRFISGDLAVYFGFASEASEIRNKNPNLDFDVAKIPQTIDAANVVTSGKMFALAITNASQQKAAALQAAMTLVNRSAISKLSEISSLPPVRRDLLTSTPNESFLAVFYQSAIQARSWLKPDIAATNAIFREMVESVTGGRRTVQESVTRADAEMNALYSRIK